MHRKDVAVYFLQITKTRMLQMQGEKRLNGLHPILGRINRLQEVTFKICSKHLLPQLRVREF